jgi:hypothetical protein
LPVNQEVFDTFVVRSTDARGVIVEVLIDDPRKAAEVVAVLRRHHAQQIEREVA